MPRADLPLRGMSEVLVSSGARTTSGNSAAVAGFGAANVIRAQLNVTAVSGTTPNMVVRIEDSLDGANWNTIGTFAARTSNGREVINVTTPFADQVRIAWTITGTTPSFTFAVVAYTE